MVQLWEWPIQVCSVWELVCNISLLLPQKPTQTSAEGSFFSSFPSHVLSGVSHHNGRKRNISMSEPWPQGQQADSSRLSVVSFLLRHTRLGFSRDYLPTLAIQRESPSWRTARCSWRLAETDREYAHANWQDLSIPQGKSSLCCNPGFPLQPCFPCRRELLENRVTGCFLLQDSGTGNLHAKMNGARNTFNS